VEFPIPESAARQRARLALTMKFVYRCELIISLAIYLQPANSQAIRTLDPGIAGVTAVFE
jgi:hypothetical protein